MKQEAGTIKSDQIAPISQKLQPPGKDTDSKSKQIPASPFPPLEESSPLIARNAPMTAMTSPKAPQEQSPDGLLSPKIAFEVESSPRMRRKSAQTGKGWMAVKRRLKEVIEIGMKEKRRDEEIFRGSSISRKIVRITILDPLKGLGRLVVALRGLTLLVTLLFSPFVFAFPPPGFPNPPVTVLIIMDCIYFLILLLQMFAFGYHDQQNILVGDRRLIIKNFFKNKWRVAYRIYMLAPWYLIGPEFALLKMVGVLEMSKILCFFPELIQLFFDLLPFLDVSTLKIEFVNVAMNALTVMILIFNFTSCIWLKVNSYSTILTAYTDYVNGFYFLAETSSTIGYGDNTAILLNGKQGLSQPSDGRYVFGIFMILFGLNYFAFVQSLIVRSINILFEVDRIAKEKKDDLVDWMAVRNNTVGSKIEWSYEKKILDYFDYLMRQDIISTLNEKGYIDLLSEKDKESIETYTTDSVVERFDLFKRISRDTATKIFLLGTPRSFEKDEIILNVGDSSEGILLILSGMVEPTIEYKIGSVCLNPIEGGGFIGGSTLAGGRHLFNYQSKNTTLCLEIEESIIKALLEKSHLEEASLLKYLEKNYKRDEKNLGRGKAKIDEKILKKEEEEEKKLALLNPIEEASEAREEPSRPPVKSPEELSELPEKATSKNISEPEPEHHIAKNFPSGKTKSVLSIKPKKNQILPMIFSEVPMLTTPSEITDLFTVPNDDEEDDEVQSLVFKEYKVTFRKDDRPKPVAGKEEPAKSRKSSIKQSSNNQKQEGKPSEVTDLSGKKAKEKMEAFISELFPGRNPSKEEEETEDADRSLMMTSVGTSIRFGELFQERGLEVCNRLEGKLAYIRKKYESMIKNMFSAVKLLDEEMELLANDDGKKKNIHLFGLKLSVNS